MVNLASNVPSLQCPEKQNIGHEIKVNAALTGAIC